MPFSVRRGLRQDLATCRALLRGGSRSFFLASLLLPRAVRDPASALYAFCRLADDAVDVEGGSVAGLRHRLDRAYAGQPLPIAADRALAAMVARFAIPRALPEAMLEGFAWDTEGRAYESLADVRAYAVRVAGAVGAMMAVLMGARSAVQLARACDLGVAMQLTNIARDVGEDAAAGRLYLPRSWMQEEGIDPDCWLARPVFDPALGRVIRRLLREADMLYARARPAIDRLPFAYRPGIAAAGLLYAEIGRELERQGFDSIASRAVVPPRRKLWLAARALAPCLRAGSDDASVLPEARSLVEAASVRPAREGSRVVWLIELFDRLERQQRERAANVGIPSTL